MLVADGQFLLLLDVPIQDRAQHFQTYEIFNLPVPNGDISEKYKNSDKYIGITYDETEAVMITEQQYSTCLHGKQQFCKIDAPFQALTEPPTCIMTLYTKNYQEIEVHCSLSILHTQPTFPPIVIMSNLWIFISTPTMQGSAIKMICPDKVTRSSPFQMPFHILRLPPACSATLRYFHLPPHYEADMMNYACIPQ